MCKLGLEEICSIDTDDCHITVVPFYSVRTAKLVHLNNCYSTSNSTYTCIYTCIYLCIYLSR